MQTAEYIITHARNLYNMHVKCVLMYCTVRFFIAEQLTICNLIPIRGFEREKARK